MKRPTIPSKPPAPSVNLHIGSAIKRARRLKPDEPASREEIVEDIGRHLSLPYGVLDLMRKEARRRGD